MDVLDDLFGEAEEIKSKNPWITYNAFMHRIREFGCGSKVSMCLLFFQSVCISEMM